MTTSTSESRDAGPRTAGDSKGSKTPSDGANAKVTPYKFDVFRGERDGNGKVLKVRTVGKATLLPGSRTYSLRLKTFFRDEFFLLPEDRSQTGANYAVLTREPAARPERKYFWHRIGEGHVLSGENRHLVEFDFDFFGRGSIFMNLYPYDTPQGKPQARPPGGGRSSRDDDSGQFGQTTSGGVHG